MSLYNQLFGFHPLAPMVLSALKLHPTGIPRFRDAWYWDPELVIYTRTGGDNRSAYTAENDRLRAVPGFLRDEDDEYDSTFALFFYALPEILVPVKARLDALTPAPRPSQRWKNLHNKMAAGDTSDPETQRAFDVGQRIFEQIEKGGDGKGVILL
jgi:hypothetical protein